MQNLPQLKYDYSDLEPFFDAKTMEIHYTKHHQAYIDKLNSALENYPELQEMEVEELLRSFDTIVPAEIKTAVQNHGGGHANHSFFWNILTKPEKSQEALDQILSGHANSKLKKIFDDFGGFEKFQEKFETEAMGRFGSGWVWLTLDSSGKSEIYSTANQDSPLMEGKTPILGLDVWEHAYYLNYQNRRADYVKAFWEVVNWTEVENRV